ncbi:hypothetical protein [Actinoallomurus acanthiterrae]
MRPGTTRGGRAEAPATADADAILVDGVCGISEIHAATGDRPLSSDRIAGAPAITRHLHTVYVLSDSASAQTLGEAVLISA